MTRQRTRIAALVAGCAVLAGGAYAVTGCALSGSTPVAAQSSAAQSSATPSSAAQPASAGANAGAAPAGESVQAVALSTAITEAGSSPGLTPVQRRVALRRVRRALARLRLLGGEHGEITFRSKEGPKTLAFERGTVTSVAGGDVTVRAADGTTWSWVVSAASVVREDGSRTTSSALSAGEPVFAAGSETGSTRNALLIAIREPASGSSGTS
jgi:hypothetical protein